MTSGDYKKLIATVKYYHCGPLTIAKLIHKTLFYPQWRECKRGSLEVMIAITECARQVQEIQELHREIEHLESRVRESSQ